MDKMQFKFRLPDGSVGCSTHATYLRNRDVSEDMIITRKSQSIAFYKSVSSHERDWRNSEFTATDYMVLPHSRYKGEKLAESTKLADILTYRDALHEYDVESDDDRPTRPIWFK